MESSTLQYVYVYLLSEQLYISFLLFHFYSQELEKGLADVHTGILDSEHVENIVEVGVLCE